MRFSIVFDKDEQNAASGFMSKVMGKEVKPTEEVEENAIMREEGYFVGDDYCVSVNLSKEWILGVFGIMEDYAETIATLEEHIEGLIANVAKMAGITNKLSALNDKLLGRNEKAA